jgi:hypothetical protein
MEVKVDVDSSLIGGLAGVHGKATTKIYELLESE